MNNSTLKLDILDITYSLLSKKKENKMFIFINNNDQTTNIYHLFFEKKRSIIACKSYFVEMKNIKQMIFFAKSL